MMVFVVATLYGLIVLWTWIQWKGMEGKFIEWNDVTMDKFGGLGFVVAVLIYGLFAIFRYPSRFISPSGGDGWMLKLVMTALSAYAPIPGVLTQMIIWFTVVRNLARPAGTSLADTGAAAMGAMGAAAKAAKSLGVKLPLPK